MLSPLRDAMQWLRPNEPLELQIAGRTLLHAALVGLAAGAIGCAFFAASESLQSLLVERAAGYDELRARGEPRGHERGGTLHLWLLVLLPAVGGLLAGWVTRFAPECQGGGGDAAIDAFHHGNGVVRRRVLLVKPLASILTLGTGGSGGREGPTMQIGAALGSTCGHYLRVRPRERRVLMVAGIAAGISAVFRTPLGAALLAIEMLYRDDFESEALIPAVLASVVAYAVSITVLGQATMFGYLTPHPFVAEHLPLYVGLAVVIAAGGSLFVGALRLAQRIAKRIPIAWVRPGIGGLGLGLFVLLMIYSVGPLLDRGEQGLGVLGGGYGAAQVSITGADWIPRGWDGVQILVLLALAKVVASSFTIGFGGSAGDFAPALTLGALLGGAFGLAARLLLDDPSIQPEAFALVGMGALYGGIANTPIAAVIMVCEMAGSYDLLVPLMFVQGITFIALRRISLYPAQLRTVHDSPVHRRRRDPLRFLRVRNVITLGKPIVTVRVALPVSELVETIESAADQDVFPVVDNSGVLCGVVEADALRMLVAKPELQHIVVAADVMQPAVAAKLDDDLRRTVELMIERDVHTIPVVDERGAVIALLDQHDIARGVMRVADAPAHESTSRLQLPDL